MDNKQLELRDILAPEPKSIYLAGPFFNDLQIKTLERVEDLCEEFKIKCNSPRKFLVLKSKASWDERKLVFYDNLTKMQQSEVVLACLDNPTSGIETGGAVQVENRPPDTGTLWEMGYAYAIGRPVVAFTTMSKKMNVMLGQSCAGFLQNIGDVSAFLEGRIDRHHPSYPEAWDFDWGVATSWLKEIY